MAIESPRLLAMPHNAGSDNRTDAELLAALRAPPRSAGDATAKQAFETLFLRYHAHLCGFAYHFVESEAVAEELVQDSFLFVWDRRTRLDIAGEAFRRYMFAAVRNAAISHLRHRKVQDERAGEVADAIALTSTPAQADRAVHEEELRRAIQGAVRELPDRCREVFVLHREQGMSYNDIAAVLGIAPKTVEIHMGRAFKLLRSALARFRNVRGGDDLAR